MLFRGGHGRTPLQKSLKTDRDMAVNELSCKNEPYLPV